MKNNKTNSRRSGMLAVIVTLALVVLSLTGGTYLMNGLTTASAESTAPIADPSPAIAVTQKTAKGVVGVSSYVEGWDRSTREKVETLYSQGSGVVIAEGGYVLTNYHVIESCTSFEILMPDGTYVKAQVVGADSSTDLAVLKVEEREDELTPVEIGSSSELVVGSTVIAIGNPGGEVLANSVTQGVVSALERNVNASNTSRAVKYIQHDAAINSGNSGGGLFDYAGRLVGINTLKYSGSVYSSVSFEGLGFAIPIDTAYPIAMDLIEYGEVQRPALGVTVMGWEGPDEPLANDPPASVMIGEVNEGSPAQEAGLQQYDFITEIDGVRVKSLIELTTELDKHKDGDTVTLTVVRYKDLTSISNLYSYYYGNGSDSSSNYGGVFPFGSNRNAYSGTNTFETMSVEVTLRILSTKK